MDSVGGTQFYEVAALLTLAAFAGLTGMLLRQPLIVAFIAIGILAGPDALNIVQSADYIELLAEIGIAVLLFLVGLKLDLQLVRTLGGVAVATGLGQVIFTTVIGFALCIALGFDAVTSLYVAVALTFSSTIIVVKLLSDKREIESLYGRIALGFLIVQDIVVVLAMVVLSGFGIGANQEGDGSLLTMLGGGVLMLAALALFIRFAAEPLMRSVAKVPELMVTFGIAWAVLMAAVSERLGLGAELGGLIAGVSLASTSYRESLASRLSSLRDFLLLFFFIGLGSRLDLGALGSQVPAALALSAFVLIGNPAIVMAIMGWMGYRKRTGFMAGLTVAQISEFSLIFIAVGLSLGHVGEEAVGLVTLVGLITITLSTYLIVYAAPIYQVLERPLSIFERRRAHREEAVTTGLQHTGRYDVLVFGLGRLGIRLASGLLKQGYRVLGIDFDPEAVRAWRARRRPALYGDAADPDFVTALPISSARWVVVAIPPHQSDITMSDFRVVLMHSLREAGYEGAVAVVSNTADDATAMTKAGADLVIRPFDDAAARAVEQILERDGQAAEPVPAAERTR